MNDKNRDTKQRSAIRAALNNATRPLNPKEILDVAQSAVPNLGIATVYRNIKTMLERQEITAVAGSGIAPCYEVEGKCPSTSGGKGLFQVDASLYEEEPKGFVLDRQLVIKVGHIVND